MEDEIGPWEDILPDARVSLRKTTTRSSVRAKSNCAIGESVPYPGKGSRNSPAQDDYGNPLIRSPNIKRRALSRTQETSMKTVAVDRFSLLIAPLDLKSVVYYSKKPRFHHTSKVRKSLVDCDVLRHWGVANIDSGERLCTSPGKVLRVADLQDVKDRVLPLRRESRAVCEFHTLRVRHFKYKSSLY